jgi:hypothetical protein
MRRSPVSARRQAAKLPFPVHILKFAFARPGLIATWLRARNLKLHHNGTPAERMP